MCLYSHHSLSCVNQFQKQRPDWNKQASICRLLGLQPAKHQVQKHLKCVPLNYEKDPDAGKDLRWEEKQTQWTLVWLGSRSWWWTGRPSVLQSMGSQRVGHNWATELNLTDSSSCLEKSHGQSTLAGYSLWGCKESDTTSRLNHPNIWEGLSQTMTNWAWIWANSKR